MGPASDGVKGVRPASAKAPAARRSFSEGGRGAGHGAPPSDGVRGLRETKSPGLKRPRPEPNEPPDLADLGRMIDLGVGDERRRELRHMRATGPEIVGEQL